MELKVKAVSGTLESSDVFVMIEPSNLKLEIEIESNVLDQFGDAIREVVETTCKDLGVNTGKITVNDKGAIDVVIKSRVQTALMRSAESKNFQWK